MSQGSWGGGGPGGGGWGPPGGAPPGGAPPGGYGPPQGGYGPPPGGGYGPPQGGGYGPPQGGGFGPPGYGPQGGPPGYTPGSGGFGRFLVQAIIGGVIGGILNLIPVINLLRCCFCLTTMAGVAIGLQIYFGSNQHDRLTSGEAAGFGATAGAIAGLITGVVGMLMMMLLGGAAMMSKSLSALPPDVARAVAFFAGSGVVQIPISLAVNAGFGALGGFLSMQIFFKNRLAA